MIMMMDENENEHERGGNGSRRRRRQRHNKGEQGEEEQQSEHIIRERLRRDDMSEKFTNLEKLLPWRPKRDRTAIVEDAVNFVKEMQRTLISLQQQKIQGSLAPTGTAPGASASTSSMAPMTLNHPTQAVSPQIQVSFGDTGQVFISITCAEDQQGFMTAVAGALEELRLDVCHCSLCKSTPRVFCVILAQPQPMSLLAPEAEIVAVLRYRISCVQN